MGDTSKSKIALKKRSNRPKSSYFKGRIFIFKGKILHFLEKNLFILCIKPTAAATRGSPVQKTPNGSGISMRNIPTSASWWVNNGAHCQFHKKLRAFQPKISQKPARLETWFCEKMAEKRRLSVTYVGEPSTLCRDRHADEEALDVAAVAG